MQRKMRDGERSGEMNKSEREKGRIKRRGTRKKGVSQGRRVVTEKKRGRERWMICYTC